MNKAERAAYMRQYRAEKKRKSGQNTERVRRYRANHPEQTREYAREQKAEWRKQQKELAALNAPAEFVSSGTDSNEEKLAHYQRLIKEADKVMEEVKAEK